MNLPQSTPICWCGGGGGLNPPIISKSTLDYQNKFYQSMFDNSIAIVMIVGGGEGWRGVMGHHVYQTLAKYVDDVKKNQFSFDKFILILKYIYDLWTHCIF